jgi:hypothetical protein
MPVKTRDQALATSGSGTNTQQFIRNFSAVCALTARDIARLHTGKRAVGLNQSAWGGTRVEAWESPASLKKCARPPFGPAPVPAKPKPPFENNASVLFNAMAAPFSKFAVRAALWYQGEANADQKEPQPMADYYACQLQSMIADWRDRKLMGDFAFLTVQLPPSVLTGTAFDKQNKTGRMQIRLAEQAAASRPGGLTDIAGTSVNLDMGGSSAWGADHPPNKNEIARRLALMAVHHAYAKQGRFTDSKTLKSSFWSGPVLKSVQQQQQQQLQDAGGLDINITFTAESSDGLQLSDVKAENINGSRNDCKLC